MESIKDRAVPVPTVREWFVLEYSKELAPLTLSFRTLEVAVRERTKLQARGYRVRLERRTSEVIP